MKTSRELPVSFICSKLITTSNFLWNQTLSTAFWLFPDEWWIFRIIMAMFYSLYVLWLNQELLLQTGKEVDTFPDFDTSLSFPEFLKLSRTWFVTMCILPIDFRCSTTCYNCKTAFLKSVRQKISGVRFTTCHFTLYQLF